MTVPTKPSKFVIINDDGMYWSNKFGWVDRTDADIFDNKEHRILNLPEGVFWLEIPTGLNE